jgi:SAM-dependent methyltransferase
MTQLHRSLKTVFKNLPQPAQRVVRRGITALKIMNAPVARLRLCTGLYPLSYSWGDDRGQEIARFYVEDLFLREFSSDIRGDCLEFSEDRYTSRFGGNRVAKVHILNKEIGNPHTTILADLTEKNEIPNDLFDCIICTHVLHIVFKINSAIMELHRILKPGGTLLVAVPHISMCDPKWHEYWRFTEEGLHVLLANVFGRENIVTRAYGNSLTAAGEIRGLAAHEFTKGELNYHDQRFAIEICARAKK